MSQLEAIWFLLLIVGFGVKPAAEGIVAVDVVVDDILTWLRWGQVMGAFRSLLSTRDQAVDA